MNLLWQQKLCNLQQLKNRRFHVPQPTFLFPLETPLRLSRNMLYGWKENSMLTNCLAACTHLSSTVSQLFEPQVQNVAIFTYRSPGDAPATITQYVAWMERQFNACQTPCSMYLSIFNSFRVIRCLSQCVSPKIAIFTTFWFSLGTPLGQSRSMFYGWKENLMLKNCLAACAHLTITVSEIQRDIGRKSSIFSYTPCILRPVRGVPVGNSAIPFGTEKLEWLGYHMVQKF